jgi:hypothetical protein
MSRKFRKTLPSYPFKNGFSALPHSDNPTNRSLGRGRVHYFIWYLAVFYRFPCSE